MCVSFIYLIKFLKVVFRHAYQPQPGGIKKGRESVVYKHIVQTALICSIVVPYKAIVQMLI